MTTPNPPRPHVVPTSSHDGDDLPNVTSSLVPHPSRGRGHTEAVEDTPHNHPTSSSQDDLNQPSTRYIVTDRTKPFWNHAHDPLLDGEWHHHRDDLYRLGASHGLAERTIANLLPRAAARRWIRRSHGYVRIRDRAAFEAALDPKEAGR